MNRARNVVGDLWKAGLAVAAGGTVLSSSCSTSDVKAILAGVEEVANRLENSRNDGISFGDWLSSELDD